MRAGHHPLLVTAVVVTGGLLGLQGRINGELASRVGSAVAAAAASFLVGLVMLAFPLMTRAVAVRRLARTPTRWWWWIGGLGGALAVAATSHAVPEIGVALVTVCLVAGTAAGALGVDSAGLGPSGRHRLTAARVSGAAVAVVAVAVSAIGTRGGSARPLLFLLLVVAGAGTTVQQAANGQLRRAAGDTLLATVVSFVGGTVALLAVAAIAGDLHLHGWPGEPWLYAGGPLGVVYIAVGAATVRALGVLRVALATVAGQLAAAVVLDLVWPEPGTRLHALTVVGAVLTLVGVWLSGRRRTTGAVA